MNSKVPVLLVTGFLGSGKTTFLNWLIHTHPNLKVSLILNEFGNVKLESQFIKQTSGGEVAELSNGCMCCVAKNDIPRVINYILDNSPKTQYILIEASGLSDPDPIHEALSNGSLQEIIRLDAILCIVDALNFQKNVLEHPIVMSQVADSDIVLISKVEEAGEEETNIIAKNLSTLGTGMKVLKFTKDLDPRLFLDPDIKSEGNKYENEVITREEHQHTHEQIKDYIFKSTKEIDLNKLHLVMQSLPSGIIRAKGSVSFQKRKFLIQYVGTKLLIEESKWKFLESHKSTILFLGQDYDENELEQKLEDCETV